MASGDTDGGTGDDGGRHEHLDADIEAGLGGPASGDSGDLPASDPGDEEPTISSWEDILDDDEWLHDDDPDAGLATTTPPPADEAELTRLRAAFQLRDVAEEARRALEQNDAQNSMNPYVLYPRSLEILDAYFDIGTAQWQRAQQPEFAPIREELEAALTVQADTLADFKAITLDYQRRFEAKMAELQPQMLQESQAAFKERLALQKRTNDEILGMNAERLARDRGQADARHKEWLRANLGIW